MNSIELDGRHIAYNLQRSKRRTLGITVDAKGQVIVTAPDYIPLNKIEKVLLKRQNWIIEKVAEKSNNVQIQPKRQYVSGESIYLFGKQYYLKIELSNDYNVEKDLHRITFYMKDYTETEKQVTSWLYEQLISVVKVISEECLRNFTSKFAIPTIPVFKIRKMEKRWGSCTEYGVIHLNPKLVAASIECIEYVIYHELTHLIRDKHNDYFYRDLIQVCPEYLRLSNKLNNETVIYAL
ncbi:M48 family metallopeptidase [Peredibacter sp. HCB2-198]|uniref:M48 family metallopeptidase n=1 Tax=Peredibacter sp. HCB2-198 TaxID=3383025 RepID=UPI0038B5753E